MFKMKINIAVYQEHDRILCRYEYLSRVVSTGTYQHDSILNQNIYHTCSGKSRISEGGVGGLQVKIKN